MRRADREPIPITIHNNHEKLCKKIDDGNAAEENDEKYTPKFKSIRSAGNGSN